MSWKRSLSPAALCVVLAAGCRGGGEDPARTESMKERLGNQARAIVILEGENGKLRGEIKELEKENEDLRSRAKALAEENRKLRATATGGGGAGRPGPEKK